MFTKFIVIVVFLLVLLSLGSAGIFLIRDRGKSNRTVKALTWRIGLSITAFLLLMLAYAFGLIQPHGVIPPNPQQQTQSPK